MTSIGLWVLGIVVGIFFFPFGLIITFIFILIASPFTNSGTKKQKQKEDLQIRLIEIEEEDKDEKDNISKLKELKKLKK